MDLLSIKSRMLSMLEGTTGFSKKPMILEPKKAPTIAPRMIDNLFELEM